MRLEHFALLEFLTRGTMNPSFQAFTRQVLDEEDAGTHVLWNPLKPAILVTSMEVLKPVLVPKSGDNAGSVSFAKPEPMSPAEQESEHVELPSPAEQPFELTETATPEVMTSHNAYQPQVMEEHLNTCGMEVLDNSMLQDEEVIIETEEEEGYGSAQDSEKIDSSTCDIDPGAELHQMEWMEVYNVPVPAYMFWNEWGLHAIYPEQLVQEAQRLGNHIEHQAQKMHRQLPYFNQGYGTLAQHPPPVQQDYYCNASSYHAHYESLKLMQRIPHA